jgi:hypothetical protein
VRKAIQISVAAAPCEPTAHPEFVEIVALCDDGAIFTGTASTNGKFEWQQLPPIPQPEIAADEVVMPKTGDAILAGNFPLPFNSSCGVFVKIKDGEVIVHSNMNEESWALWRSNTNHPWRDADGKIVEV